MGKPVGPPHAWDLFIFVLESVRTNRVYSQMNKKNLKHFDHLPSQFNRFCLFIDYQKLRQDCLYYKCLQTRKSQLSNYLPSNQSQVSNYLPSNQTTPKFYLHSLKFLYCIPDSRLLKFIDYLTLTCASLGQIKT